MKEIDFDRLLLHPKTRAKFIKDFKQGNYIGKTNEGADVLLQNFKTSLRIVCQKDFAKSICEVTEYDIAGNLTNIYFDSVSNFADIKGDE